MRIKTKLSVSLLIISLVPLLIGFLFFYYNFKKTLTESSINHLKSVASIQHARIDSILKQNMERLGLVTSRTQLRISLSNFLSDHHSEDQEKMNLILSDANTSIDDFLEISIYSLDGIIVASTDRGAIGSHHFDEAFFLRCQKEFTADEFYLDKYNQLKLYLSGPLNLNEKLIGVVVIKLKTDNMISSIQDYSGLGVTGETILSKMDKNGDILFITPTRFDPSAALKRTVSKDKNNSIFSSFGSEAILMDSIDYREQPVLAVLKFIENTGWSLAVKIDKHEAYSAISELRFLLIVGVIFSIIALTFCSLYMAKAITTPINNLAEVSKKIAEGDFQYKALVYSNDEIGLLSDAFNKMTAKITHSNSILEKKVEELNREIAERKKVESALHISEERMHLALQGGELGMWDWNLKTGEMYFSPHYFSMLGYEPDELPHSYETWISLLHPDDRDRIISTLQSKLSKHLAAWSLEFRMLHKNSDYRWILCKGKVVELDEEGKNLRASGTHLDITARKLAEAEKEQLINDLRKASAEIKTLKGIFPICASCKKIRDDKGYWNQIESYIRDHSEAEFSHGICPDCEKKLYPG